MYFEGSEKKLEVVFSKDVNLFEEEKGFWSFLVSKAKAQILSEISSEDCLAYLLSESSLFIWKDRLTMITCGQTILVNAAEEIFKKFPPRQIEAFFYERKNEHFPRLQETDFQKDVRQLQEWIPGKALRFGNIDEHHVFIFHSSKTYKPDRNDSTLEILMYDLRKDIKDIFQNPSITTKEIRDLVRTDQILPGFHVDDFKFDPIGYSLNAVREDQYYTIHVTPEDLGCYVSFETNCAEREAYKEIVQQVLECFQPQSFDIVSFDPQETQPIDVNSYNLRSFFQQSLSCGYGVFYSHYFKPCKEPQSAVEI